MDIRPIDANALWKRCSDLYDKYDNIYCAYEEIDNAPTLSLNTLRDVIYQDAMEHGLWEDTEKKALKFLTKTGNDYSLYNSALRSICAWKIREEAMELERECENAECFDEELADVIIMSMSVAGNLGIDIDAAIRNKMAVNKQRPWKHGKE